MASAMRVFRKFQSADGRIKIGTLSGVSVLVTVVALSVGVLPAIADDGGAPSTERNVQPHVIDFGGGSGGCDVVESVAGNELHINNPVTGATTTHIGPDGTEITLTVNASDTLFDFKVETPGIAVYDVTVNGGSKSNHYDYDAPGSVGAVSSDTGLHAPPKSGGMADFFNLSHVNICYDGSTQFDCGQAVPLTDPNGPFTAATATIFTNSVVTCPVEGKLGSFFIDNTDTETDDPTVKLDFGTGDGVIAGRLDVTKDFGDPSLFVDLQYERSDTSPRVDVIWCNVRSVVEGTDEEAQFGDGVLPPGQYPSLLDDSGNPLKDSDGEDATACKVFEGENAAGIQDTVLYFQFLDPNFY